jgi:lipopolysaccharide export system protein LptA
MLAALLGGCLSLSAQPVGLQGDQLTFESSGGKRLQILEGNVHFEQDGNDVYCDRAEYELNTNQLYGTGNVRVLSKDGVTVNGGVIRYDANSKVARIEQDVVLTDGEMVLKTPWISYNTTTRIGFYNQGGHIVNGDIDLKSGSGSYNPANKTLYFRRNVVLLHPEYSMYGDTLQYNTATRTAWFFGPTEIRSDDNTIFCNYGWYNTRSGKSQFTKDVVIYSKENILRADSMSYNREAGTGNAVGNLVLRDTAQGLIIYGSSGRYNRLQRYSGVYGNPVARRLEPGGDTMYLKADTFVYLQDSSRQGGLLKAYKKARVLQLAYAASCDSLVYSVHDSLFTLYGNPMMWNEQTQINSDTIRLLMKNRSIDRVLLRRNSFVAMKEDSLHFSQISGNDMEHLFGADRKIRKTKVLGEGKSVYFIKNDDGSLGSANVISCGEMTFYFDSSRISEVRFYGSPAGNVYPLNQLPEGKAVLPGLNWLESTKPRLEEFAIIGGWPVLPTAEAKRANLKQRKEPKPLQQDRPKKVKR